MQMVRNFFLKKNLIEVDVVNMDIGILHILVSEVVFLYLMEVSRNSPEEIYLGKTNLSNLKKNSYDRIVYCAYHSCFIYSFYGWSYWLFNW